ncbi:MAG TPA: thioredoxin domain-containing protein, partial [Candidatus Solibacter sp.]|nr:thioredoxin domain-containing protein [Candidatus Solibacter sp.]
MENGDRNLNQWVEDRMSRLDAPGGWQPDAESALAGVHRKNRTVNRRRWGVSVAVLIAIGSALFTIPGCQAATCKVRSDNLAERLWKAVFVPKTPPKPRQVSEVVPATPEATPQPESPAASLSKPDRMPTQFAIPKNFKESGSPAAPITCEIFADYECPACAHMYLEIVPQLVDEYVATGKVKLLHRDFPLPQHAHSRLAARYAYAAGLAGQYDTAVRQIFSTQASWGLSGDLEAALSQAMLPETLAKIRKLLDDRRVDESIDADIAQGRTDQITRTPSVVIVKNG